MEKHPEIKEKVPLAQMTTLEVGGPARYFTEVGSEEDLRDALKFAEENGLEVFVLGGGSNVLISDSGFDGLVIRIGLKGVSTLELPAPGSAVLVTAMAGEDWDSFVGWCVSSGLAGLECLSGIPGLVGGTPIQNVGAYGQEVSETVVSVRVLDRRDLSVKDLSRDECEFRYRRSIFNTIDKDRYIVLSVTYELEKDGAPKIAYRDLEGTVGENPSLKEVRDAVRSIRASKGMLVRQGGADARSAGSFFKNPVVSKVDFEKISAVEGADGLEIPGYPSPDGDVKIPAAWLIEQSGFRKGYKKGNAGLSTVHALALTNRGGATAKELVSLKEEIAEAVFSKWEIRLEPEPNFIGF